jgi:transcriptional regulator with XRE-family HTH domain
VVNIGRNLRYYRLKAGLTQSQTCLAIGWNFTNPCKGGPLSAYERGTKGYAKPGFDILERFAKAFGCSMSDLIAETLPSDADELLRRAERKKRVQKSTLEVVS